jgi:RNA polymerase sigma-70 factor (ECF subfamily)
MSVTENMHNISRMERATLVERFQNGEMSVFDEIVKRYHKRVYGLAYQFTRNCDDAYDISQEVFIKVFRSLSKLRESSNFHTWLRRVTVNVCIDHLRHRPNERVLDHLHYSDHEHSSKAHTEPPNRPVEMAELRNVISRAVDRLPKRQREAFTLRYYEGLSQKKIAETLNCSHGTVKAHLFHATRRLRKLLLPYVS